MTFAASEGHVVQGQGQAKVTCSKNSLLQQLRNGLKDFDQILYKYSIYYGDELSTFWRSWSQSQGR